MYNKLFFYYARLSFAGAFWSFSKLSFLHMSLFDFYETESSNQTLESNKDLNETHYLKRRLLSKY